MKGAAAVKLPTENAPGYPQKKGEGGGANASERGSWGRW